MIVNDFLMAIFFLLVGLEIKQEILHGNLSSFKKASFPVISAIGGVLVPALIFLFFNGSNEFASGIGIPISTDIAFAVGIFMMLKNKINPSLKIFLLSLAVVDDLISILVIGVLYSSDVNIMALILAFTTFILLIVMNKKLNINKITPYLIVGFILWIFIYTSGVHATISGVILAVAIPTSMNNNKESLSKTLEHKLTPLCNYLILPLFALINTAITFNINTNIASVNNLIFGIVIGLSVGKPLGIMLFSFIATKLHITEKPDNTSWSSVFCVSTLAGIGFTMSIFVSEIAFWGNDAVIDIAKICILVASVISIAGTYCIVTVLDLYRNKVYVKQVGVYKYLFSNHHSA